MEGCAEHREMSVKLHQRDLGTTWLDVGVGRSLGDFQTPLISHPSQWLSSKKQHVPPSIKKYAT